MGEHKGKGQCTKQEMKVGGSVGHTEPMTQRGATGSTGLSVEAREDHAIVLLLYNVCIHFIVNYLQHSLCLWGGRASKIYN